MRETIDTETAVMNTFLTFTLGDEQYAVDVGKAREVLEFTSITKVPRTPEFMRGVINLRGSVVPVCDIRLKFGMSRTEKTIDTRIVVMEMELAGETTVLGVLADSVQEVADIDSKDIEPPPRIGTSINTDFIRGMGKRNDKFVILLDIDKVFSREELDDFREAKESTPVVAEGPDKADT